MESGENVWARGFGPIWLIVHDSAVLLLVGAAKMSENWKVGLSVDAGERCW